MQRNGKAVLHDLNLTTGLKIGLVAENIRRANTGLHARVSFTLDGRGIAWDAFNIERESDRIHLTGSAWRRLEKVKGIKDDLTRDKLQLLLDDFCVGVWPLWTERLAPEELGDNEEVLPLTMLLDPYIIAGGGTILFAPPGRGKTYLGLTMAVCIDANLSDLWPVSRCRVAYLNLERSKDSFLRRLKLVNAALGLPIDRKLLVTNARGWNLSDVVDGLESIMESQSIGCVFVDSLSRSGYGDLNENSSANAIMDSLNGLGVTWCVIGHTPRSDETHVFGSQMFDAAADVTIQILSQLKDDGTLGVGLKVTKANDIARPPLAIYAMEFDKYGLACIRQATGGEFLEVEAERSVSMIQQVREFLLSVGKSDATTVADELGFARQNVSQLLNHDDGFVMVGKDGRRVLFGVKGDTSTTHQPRLDTKEAIK